MLRKIASWSFRHRLVVVAAWIVALVAFNVAAMAFGGQTRQDYLAPGTESTAAAELLTQRFPAASGDTVTVVIDDARGVTSPQVRRVVEPMLDQLAGLPHVTGVTAPWQPEGAAQVNADGHVGFAVVQLDVPASRFPVEAATTMLEASEAANAAGVHVELGGQAISAAEAGSLGSEIPGLVIAAVILFVAFGSLVAMGLPLATALVGVGIGMAGGTLLARLVSVPDWASSVAMMIGLGVGIDYALLIVTRYRSELASGHEPRKAASIAMATAGRSVVFAGVTVVISLLGMLTMNQPYVAGVAISAVITVGAVLAATLTLLPALIGFAGRNIDRFGLPRRRRSIRQPGSRQGFWFGWSRSVQRRPLIAGGAGLAVLAVLILPVFGLKLGFPDAGNDAASTTTRQAYDLLTDGFGPGANGTFVLVADQGDPETLQVLDGLADDLRATPGVAAVSPVIPNADGTAAVITLTPAASPQDDATTDLLSNLREEVVPAAVDGTDVTVSIGGLTAANADQTASIAARLPIFIAAVIGLSFLLLLAVFRSVPVAIKAAVLNLLSIIAAYGVVSFAAQGGWFGSLFGITTPTPIPAFIPMMMFAILFGLSMDYEVFLLSRIREEYLRTKDTSLAVADGIASTAKVITAAALIMTVVFGAFVFDDQVFLKIIGIGMAAAVIIDATVVRLLLVPAVMQLLGDRAWWMPAWLDRVIPALDIEGPPSEPADEVDAPSTDPTTPTLTIGA